MADSRQLEMLKKGAKAWNRWRVRGAVKPDLVRADLVAASIGPAELRGADLECANLFGADLIGADLSGANLKAANLGGACLREAKLVGADLSWANLSGTSLLGADLSGACLRHSRLVGTDLRNATLCECQIYGISAWNIKLDEKTIQSNLTITPQTQAIIQVDNLEVAQFIYLILNNQKLREVIDTITSKVVLILGNFAPERKPSLDAVREALRKRGYLPVLFDFEEPKSRDLDETVSTLAHMARFIFADITDPRSVPHELRGIVPTLSVPVQTLILASQNHYAMVEGLYKYRWFLEIFRYDDLKNLITSLNTLIDGAEARVKEMAALINK
jgi:uncharacterized protein YjbI with pentapeptide repeats